MPPLNKLIHRARAKLINWSVPVTDQPSRIIVLANGGIMNNISVTQISSLTPESKVLTTQPKKKSYAYVTFESIDQGKKDLNSLFLTVLSIL